MAKLLRVPAVAANDAEALLSGWLLEEGATFAAGVPIALIETEKAAVEIEADSDGILLKTLVRPDSPVEVGDPIALLGEPAEASADVETLLRELGVGREGAVATTSLAPSTAPTVRAPQTAVLKTTDAAPRLFASPLARRLARERNLDLGAISGTGPNGRIRRKDLLEAPAHQVDVRATEPGLPGLPPSGREAAVTGVPHTRMRRAIASRLQESKRNAPHFYVRATCLADRLVAAREQLNGASHVKVSLNDLLVKAAAHAHAQTPEMNVIWTDDEVLHFVGADIAVAVATDTGLVTPVLRSVGRMTVSDVSATVRDFAVRARAGQITPDELVGGSLTITNLGMFGTEEFAAIINPPQAAILAVGAVQDSVVASDGVPVVAKTIRAVLSVDHRPVDGVVAARWMGHFKAAVEEPLLMLL